MKFGKYFVLLTCLALILISSSKLFAQTDSLNYFSMRQPHHYPPYDESKIHSGRVTLMIGHLAHSLPMSLIQSRMITSGIRSSSPFIPLGIFLATASPPVVKAFKGEVEPSAFWLNHHFELLGAVYGMALEGGDIRYGGSKRNLYGGISSIGLGAFGYWLGKKDEWDDNRVSHYKHYGTMGFSAGLILAPRAVTTLAGAGTGYIIGHKLAENSNRSRGDFIANDAFTMFGLYYSINTMLLLEDQFQESAATSLIPIGGMISSSTISRIWLSNARLSRSQGKQLGGILLGSVATDFVLQTLVLPDLGNYPDFPYLESALPTFLTGTLLYKLLLESMKTKNLNKRGILNDNTQSSLSIAPPAPIVDGDNTFNLSNLEDQSFTSPQLKLSIRF